MPAKQTIKILLVDGAPRGLRTIELGNWTGKAVACPRADLGRLLQRDEVQRTGVYILSGYEEEDPTQLVVYVGEADDVAVRLKQHDADEKKAFWRDVFFFVNKDENLTKAHVRYLEAQLIAEATQAKRCKLVNGTMPGERKLPESDLADMGVYLENLKLILAALGVDIFQPPPPALVAAPGASPLPGGANVQFELMSKGCTARAREQGGEFIVLQGSEARKEVSSNAPAHVVKRRAALQGKGVLVPDGDRLRFTQDYPFDSPSGAAVMVVGYTVNGRRSWKVASTGQMYDDWRKEQLQAISP